MQGEEPQITRRALASCQCCVPSGWTDEQVLEFVGRENPTGLDHGWSVRKQGDEALRGADERVPCEMRLGFVHIMLDC